jgi:hypothetical protein
MATKDAEKLTTSYLKDQAKIMRKYGETPKLSGKIYEAAFKSIASTFETISSVK